MANSICQVLLTETALLVPAQQPSLETGALVDFWGVVREMEAGSRIAGINYEAHRPMAQHQLELIAEEAREMFHVIQITISHRLGFVPTGEASLLVRVGSRHRAAAFQATSSVVEELKKRAPIWKHPVFLEGPQGKMIRAKEEGRAIQSLA
jgi:molybdopterin synthase catalytic subunit